MRMKRDDWKGLGTSVVIHALLLFFFAIIAAAPRPQPLGMIEVEFGPVEFAQPAARAETRQPAPTRTEPERRPQPQPPAPQPQPRRTERVDVPVTRDTPAEDQVQPPRPDPAPPRPESQARPQEQTAATADQDRTAGNPEGATGTTSDTGQPGDATARRAPFNIEGLNRTPQVFPLPGNPGARGTSVIDICVGPSGNVSSARPGRRTGTPALDNAALQAVRQWRFNALPPAAPQVEQCGRVIFTFTLN